MSNLSVDLIKKLYYGEELGIWEIANKLKVSPWKIWRFMIKNNLPRRTLSEANIVKMKKKSGTFSLKQNLSLDEEKLKIAGIMLYWTEGAKFNPINRSEIVDFSNSNPNMIKLFLKFLRKICRVSERRLRVLLYCYADQNIETLKQYWHRVTKIPLKQFTKPYIRKDFLPEKSGKMKYGLVHIRYGEMKLLLQIEDWVKEYLKKNNIRVGTEVDKPGSL